MSILMIIIFIFLYGRFCISSSINVFGVCRTDMGF